MAKQAGNADDIAANAGNSKNWANIDNFDYEKNFTNKFLYIVSYSLNFNVKLRFYLAILIHLEYQ